MNVLDLLNDLDNEKIQIKGLNIDFDNKKIDLILEVYKLEDILNAHEILKKRGIIFISKGFDISVKYGISINNEKV